jgi:ABC-type transporter Mla subunit MlaD
MSEATFRIVVAAAVLVACLAFVVQAGIVFALFRLTRKMQDQSDEFMQRAAPLLAKVEPVLDKVGPVIEKIGPVLDSIDVMAAKLGPVVERASAFIQSVNQVAVSTNQIMQDARPRIAHLSDETVAIVRSGREQVERIGDLLHDAGDRTRVRLEQIDHAVDLTVNQIENASIAMKSAVLRPVREVNGIAAGISAAVSTLVRGTHKSSVASATQDEEMFI